MDSHNTSPNIPLFEGLTPADRAALVALATVVHCGGDEVVVAEGSATDALYLILEGTVAVLKRLDDGQQELLSLLTGGDYFGEMALLSTSQRMATVRTLEPSRFAVIHFEPLRNFMQAHPAAGMLICRRFAETLSVRLREVTGKLQDAMMRGLFATSPGAPDDTYQPLRTPATVLKGMTDMLDDPGMSRETQEYFLRIMRTQVEQLGAHLASFRLPRRSGA